MLILKRVYNKPQGMRRNYLCKLKVYMKFMELEWSWLEIGRKILGSGVIPRILL